MSSPTVVVVVVVIAVVVAVLVGLIVASSSSGRSRSTNSYAAPKDPPRPASPPAAHVAPISPQELQSTLQRRLGDAWQREQVATRNRVLDQEAKISRRLQQVLGTYQFEELKGLHRQSWQTADLVYSQLQQARSASSSLAYALNASTGATAAAVRRDKYIIDSFVSQYANDVQRLNRATGTLRDRIRDSCGTAGRDWYSALMQRREQRRH